MTMIDNDLVGLFALLGSVYIAGVFVYVQHLFRTENAEKAAKLKTSRAVSDGLKATIRTAPVKCCPGESAAPVKCCRRYKETTLDA